MKARTLLASIGIALAPLTLCASAANFNADFMDDVALQVQLDPTHFVARSLAEAPLLLIFASADHSSEVGFWLPPGASYVEEFPRGTLDGLSLEVVTLSHGNLATTGSLFLTDSTSVGSASLWVLDCGHVLSQSGEGAPLVATYSDGSSLPPRLSTSVRPQDHIRTMHVPVPTPSDKPKENKPPKLGDKPLPPV